MTTSIRETTETGLPSTYYADQVAYALSSNPDLGYVSTYFPEGVEIAKALTAGGSAPRCLMGLANVDNGFLAQTSVAEAQRCVFSGVPAATKMPSAVRYLRAYRAMFRRTPSVWGSFTYDSAKICSRRSTEPRATRSRPSSASCDAPWGIAAPRGRSRSTGRPATAPRSRSASSAWTAGRDS
jgi:hypothetical protein